MSGALESNSGRSDVPQTINSKYEWQHEQNLGSRWQSPASTAHPQQLTTLCTHLTSFSISTAVFPVHPGQTVPLSFVLHFYQKRSFEDKWHRLLQADVPVTQPTCQSADRNVFILVRLLTYKKWAAEKSGYYTLHGLPLWHNANQHASKIYTWHDHNDSCPQHRSSTSSGGWSFAACMRSRTSYAALSAFVFEWTVFM